MYMITVILQTILDHMNELTQQNAPPRMYPSTEPLITPPTSPSSSSSSSQVLSDTDETPLLFNSNRYSLEPETESSEFTPLSYKGMEGIDNFHSGRKLSD